MADGYERRKLRTFRADDDVIGPADAALSAIASPRRVTVTLQPGVTRSAAIVAFLRALAR